MTRYRVNWRRYDGRWLCRLGELRRAVKRADGDPRRQVRVTGMSNCIGNDRRIPARFWRAW